MNETNASRNAFGPLLILSLALALWFGYQCVALIDEGQRLDALHQKQEPLIAHAAKLRTALQSLADETRKLADNGNPRAQAIMTELRKEAAEFAADAPPAKRK